MNIYSSSKESVNAAYNWWGTTDTQAISQKIYDNKNDFHLGTVTFEPFLTAPNPEAPDVSYVPTPTPSPTDSPAPTSTPDQEPTLKPEQVESIIGVAIAVAVIGAGLGLLIYLIKRK